MATELGVGYISLIPDGSKLPKLVDKQMTSAGKTGAKAFGVGLGKNLGGVSKAFGAAGKDAGEALAKSALSAAKSDVARLSKTVASVTDAQAAAVGRLRVTQAKLAEVQGDSKAKASQLAAAEEAVAAAQRKVDSTSAAAKDATDKLTAAQQRAKKAADGVAKAQSNAGAQAVKAGNRSGGQFGTGFSKSLSGIGGRVSGALKAIPAAIPLVVGSAIGVALVQGIAEAMDVQDVNAKLTASLGLTKAESAKVGKIAGDLYKNAFGESVAEVGDVLTTVFQSGLASTKSSEDAIKGVTEQVLNFSKISGEEALPVTRAVSQMLKTGLAKNATQAFDILTRGQQLGINKSEDLLDTFNEYGTQFRKLGLDGPKALGLMNQALQAGARDSDIAADALKEFSIRAVDGSKTTIDGFKSLKLNAKSMQEQIAGGGPKAAAGLDTVLDRLRAVKDPAERSRIAFELFGTQSEDLGAALFAIDPSKAVRGLGDLQGAAQDAGDTLNDTASNKLGAVVRTLKMSLVDALGKYALPKLEQFADWFNGPGKFVLVSWALEGGSAILGLADKMLGALQSMLGGLSKYAKIALIAAAGTIAAFDPVRAVQMLKQADALGDWADQAKTGIGDARKELQGWKEGLDKANTKVKLTADLTDLEAQLTKARKELANPKLTATRKAQLKADITNLEKNIDIAKQKLGQPSLTATKVAKLQADKKNLEDKITAAKKALSDPKLTAEKKAKLNADIKSLQTQVNTAQTKINSLTGKTVTINLNAVVSKQYANLLSGKLDYYGHPIGKAKGGLIPGRAGGGLIPGTPTTTDNMIAIAPFGPMGVASGEFLVNSRDTAKNLPLLQAINSGKTVGGTGVSRAELTITNWQTGQGYLRQIAADEIGAVSEFAAATGRMR